MGEERTCYKVYVKTNSDGFITAVNSSVFLADTAGWTEIDSGYGDRFGHAQTAYFSAPLITHSDVYRYRLVKGAAVECTAEELAGQEEVRVFRERSLEERISLLERSTTELTKVIAEKLSTAAQSR